GTPTAVPAGRGGPPRGSICSARNTRPVGGGPARAGSRATIPTPHRSALPSASRPLASTRTGAPSGAHRRSVTWMGVGVSRAIGTVGPAITTGAITTGTLTRGCPGSPPHDRVVAPGVVAIAAWAAGASPSRQARPGEVNVLPIANAGPGAG